MAERKVRALGGVVNLFLVISVSHETGLNPVG